MKPVVITKYHEKVIWKTFAVITAITIALFLYGKYVPKAIEGKQSASCEGAINTLAALEKNPVEAGASNSKIEDARQLAETECAKLN